MRVLEAVARIVQLGGAPEQAARVAEMRAAFEHRTGEFAPDDDWFEERSRAFWCDAVTHGRFGREVHDALTAEERVWLYPLERSHRGLFRAEDGVLVDAWSGAEFVITVIDDDSRAELAAAAGQLFDARVSATYGIANDSVRSLVVALLPGAVFHPRDATVAIGPVLDAARDRHLSTDHALDALLRMERALRSLSRVKAAYAYRPDALAPRVAGFERSPRDKRY
ncbi:MAG: hypothetical protein M3O46_21035 [Myxococcota bacterium]|nr:hypothetical protein [Myxococcota bacterium]